MKTSTKTLFTSRLSTILLLTLLGFNSIIAQSEKGVRAIEQATENLSSYYDPISKLVFTLAALLALGGAFHVFSLLQKGDDRAKEVGVKYITGIIVLLILVGVLKIIFID